MAGFGGVLISTGQKRSGVLWRCVNDYGASPVTAAEAGLEGVLSARSNLHGRYGHL